MLLIVDFGSQTTQLIRRRLKEIGVASELIHPEDALQEIAAKKPEGLIFSGGPSSVYEKGAPTIDPKVFEEGLPILGICYGLQLMGKLLGGEVIGGRKEYGPAKLTVKNQTAKLTKGLPEEFTVWMSHGDEVKKMPEAFEIVGLTESVPYTFVENDAQKLYGVQFHPEVEHTEFGKIILENFVELTGASIKIEEIDVDSLVTDIKEKVGDAYVIGAVSGGVDSTVAGALCAKAIGERFIPIYVENGLMRAGTREHVEKFFGSYHVKPDVVECEAEMLEKLKGKTDPEEKRKIIGNFYIEIFERELRRIEKSGKNVKFLLQGTIYSDVIESQGTKHASKIKSHHNVGGLPEDMKLELLEPMRYFFKDEVRVIGTKLGLPEEFVWKQVFPGPGYAIRIRGEITQERLEQERAADIIVLDELTKANVMKDIYMSFPIMTGAQSTAVKGDGRFFGEVIALRIIESKDVMTTTWARLPYDLLQKISSRIVNEVPGVSRVVYDITTKPPATMEWE
jgi:GMP synthase (glutamine-hydrolysing)